MTPEEQIRDIFSKAIEFESIQQREDFIVEQCSNDAELLQQIRKRLAAHDEANAFLDTLARTSKQSDSAKLKDSTLNVSGEPTTGLQIGPYLLTEKIGAGSFGLVFRAKQVEPVQRSVALKLIRPGMSSEEVLTRFAIERQALAMMDHPGIAKILDAGTTQSGQPYFVMELVEGLPITDYCDQNHLSTETRLQIFRDVCSAVEHAHQKGIIHRDLKPSNILISDTGNDAVPKVIDFGVAKAIEADVSVNLNVTVDRQLIGTPLYMSPEQAAASRDIDVRSDIYSLGVLLYELLTGSTPILKQDSEGRDFRDVLDMIQHDEPQKPSRRLSQLQPQIEKIAIKRSSNPSRLMSLIRGDLDWIVTKAMEKDRSRRYGSAGELAKDVTRFLAGDPIEARPPSAQYRLNRFARKNRIPIAIAASFAAVLIAATCFSSWQALRAIENENVALGALEAERKAKLEETRLRGIAEAAQKKSDKSLAAEAEKRREFQAMWDFVLDTLNSPSPVADGRKVTVAELLDRQSQSLPDQFPDDPNTRATMMFAIGKTYVGLGLHDKAMPLIARAEDVRRELHGDGDPSTLDVLHTRANLDVIMGRIDEGVLAAEELLRFERSLPDNDANIVRAMCTLGGACETAGEVDRALKLLTEAVELSTQSLGENSSRTIDAVRILANAHSAAGNTAYVSELRERAYLAAVELYGPRSYQTLEFMNSIALSKLDAGESDQALELFDELVPIAEEMLGKKHPGYASYLANRAAALNSAGKYSESIDAYERALSIHREYASEDFYGEVSIMVSMSRPLKLYDKLPRALEVLEKALKIVNRELGPSHLKTINVRRELAFVHLHNENYRKAISMLQSTLDTARESLGPEHPSTIACLSGLGNMHEMTQRNRKAGEMYEQAMSLREKTSGDEHPETLAIRCALGRIYCRTDRLEKGKTLLLDTFNAQQEIVGSDHPQTIDTAHELAAAYEKTGQPELATPLRETVADARREIYGNLNIKTHYAINGLAMNYVKVSRFEDARTLFKELSDTCDEAFGPLDNRTLSFRLNLAMSEQKLKNYDESISVYRDVIEKRSEDGRTPPERLMILKKELAKTYFLAGQDEAGLDVIADVVDIASEVFSHDPITQSGIIGQTGLDLVPFNQLEAAEEYIRTSCKIRERQMPWSWQTSESLCLLYWIKAKRLAADSQNDPKDEAEIEEIELQFVSSYEELKIKADEIPQEIRPAVLRINQQRAVEFFQFIGKPEKAPDLTAEENGDSIGASGDAADSE